MNDDDGNVEGEGPETAEGGRSSSGAGGTGTDNDDDGRLGSSSTDGPSDPYATLNVPRDADDEAVQRSYKSLSRALHPDKQPPGPKREASQEVFVDFKNAHDILSDPVLRQAYDSHGHRGVHFLRRSMHSQDDSLFETLSSLHRTGRRNLLDDVMQYDRYRNAMKAVQTSASIELRCTTVHTQFLGEGYERPTVPELEKATVNVSVTAPPVDNGKWSMTLGGQSTTKNGEGSGNGQISVGYAPANGTDVSVDLDLGDDSKVSVNSARVFSSGTMVRTGVSTVPRTNGLAFSMSSHRALFDGNCRGMWAMGFGSDLGVHYCLLSATTLYDDWPQVTAKANVGLNPLPFKLSADRDFDDGRRGHCSVAFGWTGGVEIGATLTRALSRYAEFGVGVRHATERGLTWTFQLRRGTVSLKIPVALSTAMSGGYEWKCLYVSMLSWLIDEAVKELVADATFRLVASSSSSSGPGGKTTREEREAALRLEERLMTLDKAESDALRQVELMAKTAEAKRRVESSKDGLVVLSGRYWAEGGDSLDVTTQLQFWVANSSLRLPSATKSSLLGFYDVSAKSTAGGADARTEGVAAEGRRGGPYSWFRSAWKWLRPGGTDPSEVRRAPRLSVRYKMKGSVYELTVRDDEALVLPDPRALRLGSSDTVS